MTNREAYVFGWVFGRLNAAAYPQEIGGDLTLAAQRPYTALARIHIRTYGETTCGTVFLPLETRGVPALILLAFRR